jgi:antitoxin MazE
MDMKITAQRWGNSLGVRIPAPVARDMMLARGSEVDLQIESGRIILTPLQKPGRYRLKALVAKITPANLPASDVWGSPAGREFW